MLRYLMHDDLSPLSQNLFFYITMRPKVNIVQPKPNNPTVKQRPMHITCANVSTSAPPLFLIHRSLRLLLVVVSTFTVVKGSVALAFPP